MKELVIPQENYNRFKKKIKQMDRKAKKLGLDGVTTDVIGEEMYEDTVNGGYNKYLKIRVKGDIPKVKGWKFVAIVQHTETGNLFKSMDEVNVQDIPNKYKKSGSICEHCNVNRNRIDTYLIYNEDTDEWKQVGRTCLGDFAGSSDIESIARFYETLITLSDEEYEEVPKGFEKRYYKLFDYLCVVEEVSKEKGFVTKSRASELNVESTANYSFRRYQRQGMEGVSKETKDKITKALDWVRQLNRERANHYMYNLHMLCSNEYMEDRDIGMVASLILAYGKYLDILAEKKREQGFKSSKYVGEVKSREVFELTLHKIIQYEGFYGVGFMHVYQDKDDNVFVWSTTKMQGIEGKTYSMKCTIKDHDEYKGVRQTKITRCKIVG